MAGRVMTSFVQFLEFVIGAMLSVILVVALGEVVSRYVLGHSLVWVAELSRFLFVWLSFLAAAVAFHHRLHFRLVLLLRAIPETMHSRLELLMDLTSFAFAAVLLIQSLPVISRTSVQRSPAMLIPMNYIYLIVPISASLIVVFIALRWLEAARAGRWPAPDGSAH
jgi:TRAP-type C4-dicarboxylate transport system permease small subunit